jgi:hypothetical protein
MEVGQTGLPGERSPSNAILDPTGVPVCPATTVGTVASGAVSDNGEGRRRCSGRRHPRQSDGTAGGKHDAGGEHETNGVVEPLVTIAAVRALHAALTDAVSAPTSRRAARRLDDEGTASMNAMLRYTTPPAFPRRGGGRRTARRRRRSPRCSPSRRRQRFHDAAKATGRWDDDGGRIIDPMGGALDDRPRSADASKDARHVRPWG